MNEEYVRETAFNNRQRFDLVPFNDVRLDSGPRYLIKGLIPREGLTVIWGPPKCGKSFLVFDMLMHVCLNWEFQGRRVSPGPVVYVACEGAHGFRARIEAFRQDKLDESSEAPPFYLLPSQINLIAEHDALIDSIRDQLRDIEPVAVVIDTLNRSLAGSESHDGDMGAYVRAADAIREAFGCAVVVIHHCGIEGSRPRGHSSLTGAADAQISVTRIPPHRIRATVQYLKEGPEGTTFTGELKSVVVGQADDGDDITSCVVVECEDAQSTSQSLGPKLTHNQQTMLTVLTEAGPEGMTVEEWNANAKQIGIGERRAADLYDLRQALERKGVVYTTNKRWHVTDC